MGDPKSDATSIVDAKAHRALAATLFNRAWELMEQASRSAEDVSEMIHAAHASAWHWRQVGAPVNFARSEWQCARVYALLSRPSASMRHGRRSLEICEAEGIRGFDLAFAYEAMARAAALAGDGMEHERLHTLAVEASAEIDDEEDRTYLLAELATIPEWATRQQASDDQV
ncbi:MAG: hypothetical protein RIB32_03365 [Phycisphaerales bacterium]